jgi:hypothetical protein
MFATRMLNDRMRAKEWKIEVSCRTREPTLRLREIYSAYLRDYDLTLRPLSEHRKHRLVPQEWHGVLIVGPRFSRNIETTTDAGAATAVIEAISYFTLESRL